MKRSTKEEKEREEIEIERKVWSYVKKNIQHQPTNNNNNKKKKKEEKKKKGI